MTAPRDLTYPPHIKLSFGGTIGAPAIEVWSNTVKFADAGAAYEPDPAELAEAAESLAVPLGNWYASLEAMIGNAAQLKWIKLNWITSEGLQRPGPTIEQETQKTGMGSQFSPWIVSYALTERTALTRGRAHAGRIYPPVVSPPLAANEPYITAAVATGMATKWAEFLNAANVIMTFGGAAPGGMEAGNFYASIISPGSAMRGTAPLYMPINRVVCDRVADIQHRRNRQVPRAEGDPANVLI